MLRAGIVGLPNVGKSTLFNALTRTRKAEAANYPFCTIEPNVGVVVVPDARLEPLAKIAKSEKIVPATIEFVDIAGLVKGASQGEGLGNKFLQHIREVDAIVEVVRCFEDKDIVHVAGQLDPVADIETIQTELVLADLDTVTRAKDKLEKLARGGDKEAKESLAVAGKLLEHLNAGKRALSLALSPEEAAAARRLFLLTMKPMLFACNVAESDLATADASPHVQAVRQYAETHVGTEAVVVSAAIEAELGGPPRRGGARVPVAPRRLGLGRLEPDPRRVPPARAAHLPDGRREGVARLDDPRGRHGAPGRRGHPLGLREGFHQGRDRLLRRPRRRRLHGRRPGEGPPAAGGQGVRGPGRRRDAVQVQRLTARSKPSRCQIRRVDRGARKAAPKDPVTTSRALRRAEVRFLMRRRLAESCPLTLALSPVLGGEGITRRAISSA